MGINTRVLPKGQVCTALAMALPVLQEPHLCDFEKWPDEVDECPEARITLLRLEVESLWSKGRKQGSDIMDGVCLLHGVLALRNAGILYKSYEGLLNRAAQFLQVGPGKAVKAYKLCTHACSDSRKADKLLRILIFTMFCCILFAGSCLLHIDTKQYAGGHMRPSSIVSAGH